MKVYLIGFMGSGKTTIGRELARRLEAPFFDLDELIETSESMSIKDIFAQKGEPFFRKRERDLLRSTHYVERGVVATGGGTFTFDENIQFIQGEGLSIHLAVPFNVISRRIAGKMDERPLYKDEETARELFTARLRYYRMSDVTLDIHENETSKEIVERILIQLPRECFAAVTRRR